MKLEALHKVIKYCYLHGKTNKRADELLSVLLKLTRNKIVDRLKKFIKLPRANSNVQPELGMILVKLFRTKTSTKLHSTSGPLFLNPMTISSTLLDEKAHARVHVHLAAQSAKHGSIQLRAHVTIVY